MTDTPEFLNKANIFLCPNYFLICLHIAQDLVVICLHFTGAMNNMQATGIQKVGFQYGSLFDSTLLL